MGELFLFLISLVVVLFAVGLTFTSKAREQAEIQTGLPMGEARRQVEAAFGKLLWKPVSGSGQLNFQRRMAKYPGPVVSVAFEPGSGGTEVQVWMSEWASKFGIASGAEFAFLQQRKLIKRLTIGQPGQLG